METGPEGSKGQGPELLRQEEELTGLDQDVLTKVWQQDVQLGERKTQHTSYQPAPIPLTLTSQLPFL